MPKKELKKIYNIRCEPSTWKAAKAKAHKERTTISQKVRGWIVEYISQK